MSNEERNLVRISRTAKSRLKAVADRDHFTLAQALDTLIETALPDLESGKVRFETTLLPEQEEVAS